MAQFQLEREDLALLQNLLIRNLRVATRFRWLRFTLSVVGGLFFGMGCAALLRAYECCDRTQQYIQHFIWYGLAAVVIFVALGIWAKIQMGRTAISNDGWFLAPQTVHVSNNGIDHITKLGTSRLVWEGLQRREEDDRNLYLLVEPSLGIIIPKHALSQEELSIIKAKVL